MATDVEAVVYLMLVNSEWLQHAVFSCSFAVMLQQARRQSVALHLLRALDHVSGGPHRKLPLCLVDGHPSGRTPSHATLWYPLPSRLPGTLHDLFPTAITIGEDVSGMPTFCR